MDAMEAVRATTEQTEARRFNTGIPSLGSGLWVLRASPEAGSTACGTSFAPSLSAHPAGRWIGTGKNKNEKGRDDDASSPEVARSILRGCPGDRRGRGLCDRRRWIVDQQGVLRPTAPQQPEQP